MTLPALLPLTVIGFLSAGPSRASISPRRPLGQRVWHTAVLLICRLGDRLDGLQPALRPATHSVCVQAHRRGNAASIHHRQCAFAVEGNDMKKKSAGGSRCRRCHRCFGWPHRSAQSRVSSAAAKGGVSVHSAGSRHSQQDDEPGRRRVSSAVPRAGSSVRCGLGLWASYNQVLAGRLLGPLLGIVVWP